MINRIKNFSIKNSAKAILQRKSSLLLALLIALIITGCQTQKPIIPSDLAPKPIKKSSLTPSYKNLITRYNKNIKLFSTLWAHTDIEIHWKDNKNKRHGENGTGVLIIKRPRDLALTVGKLGHVGLWAGSNKKRFWMFNLRDDIAYTGLYKNQNKPCAKQLPLPVPPGAIGYLIGIIQIDPDKLPEKPAVQMGRGFAVVKPPGLHIRMWINPQTGVPRQIDWLDKQGKIILISRLSERYTVKIKGMDASKLPRLAHNIKIYAPDKYARLNLQLHDVSDGKEKNKIRPEVFNWQVLKKMHNPKKLIDLGSDCK